MTLKPQTHLIRVLRYQRGYKKPLILEGQVIHWPKEKTSNGRQNYRLGNTHPMAQYRLVENSCPLEE